MTERTCIKCQHPVRVERSTVRMTMRCTNAACAYVVVKNVVKKGFG